MVTHLLSLKHEFDLGAKPAFLYYQVQGIKQATSPGGNFGGGG